MTKTILKERRKSDRLNIPLVIEHSSFRKKAAIKTFSSDISGSGMRLSLQHRMERDEKLKILIHFPGDKRPVTAFSKVIWCSPKGAGKTKIFDTGIKHFKIAPKDRNRFVFLFCELMINYFMRNSLTQYR